MKVHRNCKRRPKDSVNMDIFGYFDDSSLFIGDTLKVSIFLELPKNEKENNDKRRIQVYQGVLIAKHHSSSEVFINQKSYSFNKTITVRKMFPGGGIEKVFALNSPWIKEIEVIRNSKVRRAKLYYLRERSGKSARLKMRF